MRIDILPRFLSALLVASVSPLRLVFLFSLLLVALSSVIAADERANYITQIKPLVRERCFGCHGALKQESGLRLDTVAWMLEGGDSGPVIAQDAPSESLLVKRIMSKDPTMRMPPENEGEPFNNDQVTSIQKWIESGSPAPDDEQPETDPKQHWAFLPIVRPDIPQMDSAWVRNPIDTFVAKQHEERHFTPQPEASRLILQRRLYLDLIGLPPNSDEIAESKSASADWYEINVENLLSDPRHGERWGRHWMDIWRYSDWWGLGEQLRNSQKHIWHWRDWIIESLNADTPYDEMLRLMLAADELYPNDLQKIRASGFLARNYFVFNRDSWMDETVEHISKGLLGLTLNCAKCHDHKFDPISQRDYYAMRAIFEPYHVRLDLIPGETDFEKNGIARAFDSVLDAPTYLYVRGNEATPDKSTIIAPDIPRFLEHLSFEVQPVTLPTEAWQPERRDWVFDAHISSARTKWKTAQGELQYKKESQSTDLNANELTFAEWNVALAKAELESVTRRAEAMRATSKGPNREQAKAAIRAERQVFVVSAERALAEASLRLATATVTKKQIIEKEVSQAKEALAKAKEKAAASITADESFTTLQGARWTPTRFLDSTKDDPIHDFKPLSTGRRKALANWITDRANPLTARVAVNHLWNRHFGRPLVSSVFDFGRNGTPPTHPKLLDWLASELIDNGWSMKHIHRLIVTSATYRMSSSLAGAEANMANDADNHYLWRRFPIRLESQVIRDSILAVSGELDLTMGGPSIPKTQQETSKRRSLYFVHSNNERNLFLTLFDEALVKECYRREQSVIPQQALALANSQLVLDAAPKIASRLMGSGELDDSSFVRIAFSCLLGFAASDEEVAACVRAMEDWKQLPNSNAESARARLVWALLNHNDFVTLR